MPPGMPPGMPMAHGGAVPMQSNGGVPDAMIGQAIRQVPNAFIEDSNKFNEAALADISPSDIPALTAMTQTIDMGIPRVLSMVRGGPVRMQGGREVETLEEKQNREFWERWNMRLHGTKKAPESMLSQLFSKIPTVRSPQPQPDVVPPNAVQGEFGGYDTIQEFAMKDPEGADKYLANNVKGYKWGK